MSELELWRTARPGEPYQEHFCSDYCTDESRAVGLVRVPFDEATRKMARKLRAVLAKCVVPPIAITSIDAEATMREVLAALGEEGR